MTNLSLSLSPFILTLCLAACSSISFRLLSNSNRPCSKFSFLLSSKLKVSLVDGPRPVFLVRVSSGGSALGTGTPFLALSRRCNAIENSSDVKRPSLSMSDSSLRHAQKLFSPFHWQRYVVATATTKSSQNSPPNTPLLLCLLSIRKDQQHDKDRERENTESPSKTILTISV